MATETIDIREIRLEDHMPTLEERTAAHPCFAVHCTGRNSRIHLAVAPRCNIQCNYCLRKNDCVNETRPGVTSKVLNPDQALDRYLLARDRLGNLTVVGIAGPGDALANWDATCETLTRIRQADPYVTFCLSTNGLQLPRYAEALAKLGVTHLTVTLNAVDAQVGARMYKFVAWEGKTLTGLAAAQRLLANQLEGIRLAVAAGMVVKVNTVLVKGINVDHAVEVARVAAGLGVSYQNITCMIPVPGAAFQDIEPVDEKTHAEVRKQCSEYLPQIYHCRQCRADAVGKLGEDLSALFDKLAAEKAAQVAAAGRATGTPASDAASAELGQPAEPASPQRLLPARPGRPVLRMAIATASGTDVDQHFGHADQLLVVDTDGNDTKVVERRQVSRHCYGPGACGAPELRGRLAGALSAVGDCDALLALRVGPGPREELKRAGVHIFESFGPIDEALVDAYDALCPTAFAKGAAR